MARKATASGSRADILKRLRLAIFQEDPGAAVCLRLTGGDPQLRRRPSRLIIAQERDAAEFLQQSQESHPSDCILVLGDPRQLVGPLLPVLTDLRESGDVGSVSIFVARPGAAQDALTDTLRVSGLSGLSVFEPGRGPGDWSQVSLETEGPSEGSPGDADCSGTQPGDEELTI